jgi:hypothetical protein
LLTCGFPDIESRIITAVYNEWSFPGIIERLKSVVETLVTVNRDFGVTKVC